MNFRIKNPLQNNLELVDWLLNRKFKKHFLSLFNNGSLEKILKYEILEADLDKIYTLKGLRNQWLIV